MKSRESEALRRKPIKETAPRVGANASLYLRRTRHGIGRSNRKSCQRDIINFHKTTQHNTTHLTPSFSFSSLKIPSSFAASSPLRLFNSLSSSYPPSFFIASTQKKNIHKKHHTLFYVATLTFLLNLYLSPSLWPAKKSFIRWRYPFVFFTFHVIPIRSFRCSTFILLYFIFHFAIFSLALFRYND